MKTMESGSCILKVFVLALALGTVLSGTRVHAEQHQYSRTQYRWAVNWINGPLETLMANGVIETISARGESFQVQAGDAWPRLSFRQAGDILHNLSRARQITGHSPFFTVTQSTNEAVVGRVTQSSITLLVPGEGYIDYLPESDGRENTAY